MAQTLDGWFHAQGPVTQKCLLLIVGLTLGTTLGLIPLVSIVLNFTDIFYKLQVWRLVTHLFFFGMLAGPSAFMVLMNIYLFVMYSTRLEESLFKGKRADYIWMLIVTDLALMFISGYFIGERVHSRGLLLAVIWVWCKHHPEQQMSIMGFFVVTATQFPWVLLVLHWAFGMGWLPDLVGIAAGHAWIFLRDILPDTHGWHLLPTPSILKRWLPDERLMGGMSGGYMPASRLAADAAPRRTNWGQGRVLGSD